MSIGVGDDRVNVWKIFQSGDEPDELSASTLANCGIGDAANVFNIARCLALDHGTDLLPSS